MFIEMIKVLEKHNYGVNAHKIFSKEDFSLIKQDPENSLALYVIGDISRNYAD